MYNLHLYRLGTSQKCFWTNTKCVYLWLCSTACGDGSCIPRRTFGSVLPRCLGHSVRSFFQQHLSESCLQHSRLRVGPVDNVRSKITLQFDW